MTSSSMLDLIPDARDGLTRKERIVLYCLKQAQEEMKGRNVATIMLYGRVVELIDMSQEEFQSILSRMTGLTRDTHKLPPHPDSMEPPD